VKWDMSQRCVFIIGDAVVRIARKGSETILHRWTYRKRKTVAGNSCSLKSGKWRAATLVNTLRVAKNQIKLAHRPIYWHRSLWPQPGTSAGAATVAPWVTWHINKFLCKTARKMAEDLPFGKINCEETSNLVKETVRQPGP